MAYRGDHAGETLEAPTAGGALTVRLGPARVELDLAEHSLVVAGRIATLVDRARQERRRRDERRSDRRGTFELQGELVLARGFPREDLGIWIELPGPGGPGMRRIFGVEPVSLLEPDGLVGLKRLDSVAHRLRTALAEAAGDVRRGIEIGSGHALDKVLFADHGDRYVVYARRLFRDRARFAMAVHDDGRIVVPDGKALKEIRVTSRFGVTVRGDYIRFADRQGTDLARVSIPWIGPEDRDELARRIAQLVDRE